MADSNATETGSAPPPQVTSAARQVVFAAVAWISLLCPPWQMLVTTSIPLYLNNQQDLYHNVAVLHPFLGSAIGMAFLALPIYFFALRNRVLAAIMWFYYLAGFALLGLITIHGSEAGLAISVAATVTVGVVFVLLLFVAIRWWDLRRACGYFALFTVGFVAVDAVQFTLRHVPLPDELEARAHPSSSEIQSGERLPNFYHLVLDEYQTDMFEFVLDSELRDSLGGFVFFNDATTPFGRTRMALASVFSSRSFDFATSQADYQRSAFTGRQSLLTQMLNAGYHTEAYLHARVFTPEPPFHRIRYHLAPTDYRADSSRLFRDLWIYANVPLAISLRLIDSDQFDNFQSQNVLDPSSTVKSLHSFRYAIRREPSQAARGVTSSLTCCCRTSPRFWKQTAATRRTSRQRARPHRPGARIA